MFAHWLHHPQITRLQARFAARRPRHPLMRVLVALLGISLLLVLLVVGAIVGTAMLLVGMVMRLLGQRGRPMAGRPGATKVVEGEYRVVEKSALPLGR